MLEPFDENTLAWKNVFLQFGLNFQHLRDFKDYSVNNSKDEGPSATQNNGRHTRKKRNLREKYLPCEPPLDE